MDQYNLRTYAAFLETTLPWRSNDDLIGNSFKLAFLRLPNLSIIDSQAIDSPAFQTLLKNDTFCKVINQNTSAGPSCEIHVRSESQPYETVLNYWLDVEGKRENPTELSGLSSELNEQIRQEHANKTISLSRFEEIAPEYYNHTKLLTEKINNLYKSNVQSSFRKSLDETLDDLTNTFPASSSQKLAQMLNDFWKNFEGSGRSDYLLSSREFVKEKNIDRDVQKFIEQGILSFAYQKQMSSIANGKFIPGKESNTWISKNAEIKTRQDYKITVKIPTNRFVSSLSWEGLYEIRKNKKLIQAMIDIRTSSRSPIRSEYRDSVTQYFAELIESYRNIAKKDLSPDPYYWQEVSLYIVDFLAKGAGAFFGNLLGNSIGNLGSGLGEIVTDPLSSICRGFITRNNHLVDSEFTQMIGDLSTSIQS